METQLQDYENRKFMIMNANISQVLIYNKVLSAAQNFNATKSKFGF